MTAQHQPTPCATNVHQATTRPWPPLAVHVSVGFAGVMTLHLDGCTHCVIEDFQQFSIDLIATKMMHYTVGTPLCLRFRAIDELVFRPICNMSDIFRAIGIFSWQNWSHHTVVTRIFD